MSHIYLVVKNSDEADMLRRLLPPRVREKIHFVLAEEGSSAVSTARTLLALGGQPVALLVDAGTTDETQIATQRETLDALLQNASPNLPHCVLVAAPTLLEIFATRGPVNQMPLVLEIIAFVQRVTDQLPMRPLPGAGATH
ncbi:MAG: hypothetical protein ACLQVX_05515 [Limisphaerales bacterium]